MSDWGAGEVAGTVTAGGGVLVVLGGAVRWMVTWLSGRQDKRITELERETRKLTRTVFSLGAAMVEVMHELPGESAARQRAEQALREAFPAEPEVPSDIAELVDRIRKVTA